MTCGGAWFTVQAVAMNAKASVIAYMAPVTCHDCGHVLVDGAWVPPDLTPADPAWVAVTTAPHVTWRLR